MDKETRKAKRAREKDEKLEHALREYGCLMDQLDNLKRFARQREREAADLLGPSRTVGVRGYDYRVGEDLGLHQRRLVRTERGESLDRPPVSDKWELTVNLT